MSSALASSDIDVTIQDYVNGVQRIIKSNWKPKRSDKSYTLITNFKIDKFGNVKDIVFVQGTADEEAKQAALDAIKLSEPFKRPWILRSSGTIEIEFTFDYSIKKVVSKQSTGNEQLLQPNSVTYPARKPSSSILKILIKYSAYFIIALLLLWLRIVRFLREREKDQSFKQVIKNMAKPEDYRYDPTNVKR